ncbi:MFS transporter [Janibacter terrae]|uniref:MFS transporter n=1 Tax=Janibacter terrae TaxID=103817 RepID=UPI0037F77E6A
MREPLSPDAARRVFLTLTTTRWLPIGFVVGLFTLWQLERGLTLPQALTASAVMGVAVVALELPTSGFADALGRRPVLVAAAVANVASMVALLVAQSFLAFVLASLLTGVFRALDSGPLEAWYVDTVHVSRPGADIDQDLSRSTSILGLAIAGGALLSGGLVAWHPIGSHSALWLPVVVCLALSVVHLVAVVALMREPVTHLDSTGWARAATSARATPRIIGSGLRLVRDNPVLRGLVLLECFWSTALIASESLTPVRMAELLGGEERAGVVMGPLAAVAWLVFAVGAWACGRASARWGVARAAILGRLVHSVLTIGMALAVGPIGLVVAHLLAYTGHGMQGPAYNALLHREASSANRSTVLSLASMSAFGFTAITMPLAGLLASATSTQLAMAAAGVFGLGGVWCLLPALRAERSLGDSVAPQRPEDEGQLRWDLAREVADPTEAGCEGVAGSRVDVLRPDQRLHQPGAP